VFTNYQHEKTEQLQPRPELPLHPPHLITARPDLSFIFDSLVYTHRMASLAASASVGSAPHMMMNTLVGRHSYRIVLAYDGTNYNGWQLQKSAPSIQGCMEKALGTILQVTDPACRATCACVRDMQAVRSSLLKGAALYQSSGLLLLYHCTTKCLYPSLATHLQEMWDGRPMDGKPMAQTGPRGSNIFQIFQTL
jgi:hypothetical protein